MRAARPGAAASSVICASAAAPGAGGAIMNVAGSSSFGHRRSSRSVGTEICTTAPCGRAKRWRSATAIRGISRTSASGNVASYSSEPTVCGMLKYELSWMSVLPMSGAGVRGARTSRRAPCACAAWSAQRTPSVPGPLPQMTICGRPVAIDASIAANAPIASIDTSTMRTRGCRTAASTQRTLAALMRPNAQQPGASTAIRPPQRAGCVVLSAIAATKSMRRSARVPRFGGPADGGVRDVVSLAMVGSFCEPPIGGVRLLTASGAHGANGRGRGYASSAPPGGEM